MRYKIKNINKEKERRLLQLTRDKWSRSCVRCERGLMLQSVQSQTRGSCWTLFLQGTYAWFWLCSPST